jgi:hypothetical protein
MATTHFPSLRCRFDTHRFPSGMPRGGTLRFESSDLAWALFVTGRTPGDAVAHGPASVYEFLHRSTIVPAYLRSDSGVIRRSSLYSSLDRSEKVGVSYALGAAMTGLFCAQQLGVSQLLHLDRYAGALGVNVRGRKRPDYVGRSSLGWVVAEAKGRSNAIEPRLASKLEAQKRSVISVAGTPPWLAVGVVAHFGSGTLGVRAYDPDDDDPALEPMDYAIDESLFLLSYYRPFLTAIDSGQLLDVPLDGFTVSSVGPGVRVGLATPLEEIIRQGPGRDVRGFAPAVDDLVDAVAAVDHRAVKADGSFVDVDWDDAMGTSDIEY